METLSIIAYRQPITKSEMEHIRGVSCDYAIQKLLEKDLISISGKSDGPGRPVLYSTSQSFMDYFGIRSVKDLPQLKDLHIEQNEIGSSSEYEDSEPEVAFVSEIPPVMGEEEDLQIPDRKTIFMENQVESPDEEISEENSEFRGETDPSWEFR